MVEIPVNLGERSYSVLVGRGILDNLDSLLSDRRLKGVGLFIVTDDSVQRALAPALGKLQSIPGRRSELVVIPAGEDSKSIPSFSLLLDRLAAFEEGDGAVVVAFGGGVVGDLSGFVAACYKRGIPWVQVPTTLLAQVDASVGGKCAINHSSAKNLIGAFHQPSLVVADMDSLETLPERELRSGLAEVIKHGVIADKIFFTRIEQTMERALQKDPETLKDYVKSSCIIKAAVVEADEKDTNGRRAALNYGHTIGHAVEIAAGFNYTHGEAIAIGMACAGDIAGRLNVLNAEDACRIERVLVAAGLPIRAAGLSVDAVMAAMRLDKKFVRGSNRFVLADGIGQVRLHSQVPEDLIRDVVRARMD